ncbi:MAG TPA: CoA transferase subunit A, partial [Methylomirabilota bacterium]|nr:CoA transferase subunit A [Methylomirabilota bacterium]
AVVASAERIVPLEALRRLGTGSVLEGIHVTAVIELPGGARPTRVRGEYDVDAAHLRAYVEAARDDVAFKEYLERWVHG